ncbi:MAG: adenylyl-sulfate reductase, partial [Betaproteobacteria bacterium]|nr:adenylyl-sulfate reductase [Betaproteobacteria bacterium]
MFTTNPFTALTLFVSPAALQVYLLLMALAVAIGTLFDLLHGKKIKFFLQERKRKKAAAKRQLGAAAVVAIAAWALAHDIATFGEFCKTQRRISHVLMFYGFVTYLITTIVMVFIYPADTHAP